MRLTTPPSPTTIQAILGQGIDISKKQHIDPKIGYQAQISSDANNNDSYQKVKTTPPSHIQKERQSITTDDFPPYSSFEYLIQRYHLNQIAIKASEKIANECEKFTMMKIDKTYKKAKKTLIEEMKNQREIAYNQYLSSDPFNKYNSRNPTEYDDRVQLAHLELQPGFKSEVVRIVRSNKQKELGLLARNTSGGVLQLTNKNGTCYTRYLNNHFNKTF